MKNRHLIKQGAAAVALAVILGLPAANAAEVYLQTAQFEKAIPYGSGPGVPTRSVAVTNPSFESPDCSLPGCVDSAPGSYVLGSFEGWTAVGSAGTWRPDPAIIVPTDGSQAGWSNTGGLSQNVEELAPNTTYTLSVDVGSRSDDAIDTYTIGLYANGVLLEEDNNSLSPAAGTWLTSTVSYTTGDTVVAGQTLEIRLNGTGPYAQFDNVRLEAMSSVAVVTMWGYSECTDITFGNCSAPSTPGPQIDVAAGDADGLTIHLRNTLPEATSIMIAGQKPASVVVNGAPSNVLGRTADNRLRSFAPEVPGAGSGGAGSVAVTNASFEEPDCSLPGSGCTVSGDGNYIQGSFAGWNVTGTAGLWRPDASIIVPTDGAQAGWSLGGELSQLVQELEPDTTYNLTVDVGSRVTNATDTYRVSLYADGVLLAEDNSQAPAAGSWLTSTVSYTTGSTVVPGQQLEIRLHGSVPYLQFDNVRLDASSTVNSIGTYSWPAGDLRPGAYLYQSASHVQLQVQMGLYGAMTHDAAGCGQANCAYGDAAYDAQQVLVFSEIDPALHDPVPTPANATVTGYRPQFFLVNGLPYNGSLSPVVASAGDDVLLRLINAGLDNHAIQLLNGRFEVLGEDGRRSPTSKLLYNVLLPAAKSLDLLFTPGSAGTYTLYDRRLRLMNGPVDGGGMLYPIVVN